MQQQQQYLLSVFFAGDNRFKMKCILKKIIALKGVNNFIFDHSLVGKEDKTEKKVPSLQSSFHSL